MLHQKETKRIRAYPTHQAVQTTGSTASFSFCLLDYKRILKFKMERIR
jgi:hypothetical protein